MVSELLTGRVSNQWKWWPWEVSNKKDELGRAVLTVTILLLPIFWYLWMLAKTRMAMAAPLPPGPRGLPIIGYLPFLGTELHRSFTQLAQQYGPIFKLRLGKKLCVVLSSPSLAKEVVRDSDLIFSNRDVSAAALAVTYGGLDIAWSPHGSYWRTMRKIFVREMLSNTSLEASYNLRREEVRKTIRELNSKNLGSAVDIGEITFQTEFNVVMNMLWGGNRFDTQKDNGAAAEFRPVMLKMIELLGMPNVSDFFPVLARFDLQGVERKGKALLCHAEKIFDDAIDARLRLGMVDVEDSFKNKGRKDFLQILLELMEQEDAAAPITRTQIKALLMDIMVGGTDTTATMVEWVMAEIMHNPEIMRNVQQELLDIVGTNNIVEESHVPKLHYLDAVVKETLRLHPALPLLVPRCPSQTSIVGGYTIPKDTRIFLNVWAIHTDPGVWDNPFDFRPERFLDETSKWDYSGNNFHYLPFGSGRRICAGIPLAEKMIMYVLASLLHSFNWDLPNGKGVDLSEKFGIVMKKRTPLVVIPTQRLSNSKIYE